MFKTLNILGPELPGSRVLDLVNHPDVSLAIWHRPPQPDLIQFLQAYALGGGEDLVFDATPESFSLSLLQAFIRVGLTRDPACVLLQKDIELLANIFWDLTGAPQIHTEMAIITGPHCTRFHADYNFSRMLCTYVGPGTLWTPHENVRWCQNHDDALPCVEGLHDPSLIHQLDCFDVAWLKGRLNKDSRGYGQVHRSPDLPEGMPFRILLKFDLV